MKITIKRRHGSRSITLRVLPGGEVSVNAPYWIPNFAIQEFLAYQSNWLTKKVEELRLVPKPKTRVDYLQLKPQALALAKERLAYFNNYYHLNYGKISIRNQSSRWGSCAHNGNLSFNYRIVLLEPELRDYIIVHELCHVGQMNHSTAFWALVSKTFPNYKALRKILRTKQLHLL